ncbi:MAG: endonuclease/exonuclease/phosphatase family protein [Acidobacteriota bacterium]|nr:MAG: endonuclease/exonuclease/phosphatase family protein [Acidobacteriota bacterium]
MLKRPLIFIRFILGASPVWFFIQTLPAQSEATLPDARSFLQKPAPEDAYVRVMTWNVHLDSIFPPEGRRKDSFRRIVRAVVPDVICLQEVFLTDAADRVQALLEEILPLGEGRAWQTYGASDVVIASRFPFKRCDTGNIIRFPLMRRPDFYFGQGMCLIDLPETMGEPDLYLIGTHLKSRAGAENRKMRRDHADAIVQWVRDLRTAGGEIDLPEGTPFVILGDFNVYRGDPDDAALHLVTLLTGDISGEERFGPDIKPDWDETDLIEVKPRHNATGREFYTWRADDSPFVPGALDRILYTDSVLTVAHSFVLNSTEIDQALLTSSGMLATDVLLSGEPGYFDHLPLIVDFSIIGTLGD